MPTNPAARVLADIAHALNSPEQAELRVRGVLDHLRLLVPYDCCALLETQPGSNPHRTIVPEGSGNEAVCEALGRLLSDLRESVTPNSDPLSPEVTTRPPHRFHLALPIVGFDLMGLLYVGREAPAAYAEEHLQLLAVVASQIGAYWTELHLQAENARLYEESRAANVAKDEFLGMFGHELRNPLAALSMAITLAQLDRRRIDTSLAIARRQTDQLTRLVDDLLDVERITHGKIRLRKEPVELAGVIERGVETIRSLIASRGHRLVLSLPGEPIVLEADASRLEQAVTNLLNNAAKYTDPGGEIT
ncbi:MAG: histidine kinase, partial [Gemmatimonadetes bacterium]